MKTNPIKLGTALAALSAVVVALWILTHQDEASTAPAEEQAEASVGASADSAGDDEPESKPADGVLRYRLDLNREEQVRLGAEDGGSLFEGRLHLEVEFTQTPARTPKGQPIEVVEFAAPTRCEAQLLGAPLVSTPAEAAELFRDQRVFRVPAAGGAYTLRFPREAPPLFRALASSAMAEIQFDAIPDAAEPPQWTTREETPRGAAVSLYEVSTTGRDSTVRRKRAAYSRWNYPIPADAPVSVDGAHVAVVSETGVLRRMTGQETVNAGKTLTSESTVKLELLSLKPSSPLVVDPEQWADSEEWAPSRAPSSTEVKRAMEEQRAAGLSAESVLETLTTVGRGGMVPNHREWAWKAIGRLRLDDELCGRIGQAMVDGTMTTAGRALMTDLLAQAGTPAAQRALMSALEAPELAADYGTLVSRLSLVPTPLPETVSWVRRASADPSQAAHHEPLTLTLGAVAGALAQSNPEDPAALQTAQSQANHLATSYREAETTAGRALYLDALGNAGMTATATIAVEAAEHASPALRASAARAVRKLTDEASHEMLRTLAGDTNSEVQQQAFRALQRRKLTKRDWEHFGDLAASGAISDDGLGPLTTILENHMTTNREAIAAMASRLSQQPTHRKDLHQRLLKLRTAGAF